MRKTLLLASLLICLITAAVPARAQTVAGDPRQTQKLGQIPPIDEGTKVRVSTTSSYVGVVAALSADTLYLAPARYGDPSVAVPIESITRLEVSRGRGPGAWIGGGIGLLAGAIIGGSIATSATENPCDDRGCTLGEALGSLNEQAAAGLGGIVVGGALGLLAGALIGRGLSPERWEPLSVESVRLSFRPNGGASVAISFSTRF